MYAVGLTNGTSHLSVPRFIHFLSFILSWYPAKETNTLMKICSCIKFWYVGQCCIPQFLRSVPSFETALRNCNPSITRFFLGCKMSLFSLCYWEDGVDVCFPIPPMTYNKTPWPSINNILRRFWGWREEGSPPGDLGRQASTCWEFLGEECVHKNTSTKFCFL